MHAVLYKLMHFSITMHGQAKRITYIILTIKLTLQNQIHSYIASYIVKRRLIAKVRVHGIATYSYIYNFLSI